MNLKEIKGQFATWKGLYGRFLPKERSAKIIDIGCGDGKIVYWLTNRGYEFAEGIDINRDKIDTAVNLGIKNLHHGDAMSFLRDKNSHYDVAFFLDVIPFLHQEEVRELMAKIYESLKSGGVLIIKSPNSESPMAGNLEYGRFGKQLHVTENNLKNLLRTVGFKKVGAYPLRPIIHGIPSFIRFCLWFVIEAFLKFYRLVETGTKKGVFTQSIIAIAKK